MIRPYIINSVVPAPSTEHIAGEIGIVVRRGAGQALKLTNIVEHFLKSTKTLLMWSEIIAR